MHLVGAIEWLVAEIMLKYQFTNFLNLKYLLKKLHWKYNKFKIYFKIHLKTFVVGVNVAIKSKISLCKLAKCKQHVCLKKLLIRKVICWMHQVIVKTTTENCCCQMANYEFSLFFLVTLGKYVEKCDKLG